MSGANVLLLALAAVAAALLLECRLVSGQGAASAKPPGDVVKIISSADKSTQLAIFYRPESAAPGGKSAPVPLLVGLHAWSSGYTENPGYLAEGAKRGWAVIQPDFRGPNVRPEACASDLAIQDILDAVEYACQNANIDRSRIYLVGASGGGHMGLMMAAKAPTLWAGVSVWVPASDLASWYASLKKPDQQRYRENVEKVIGGKPGEPKADEELKKRSPIWFLPQAKGLPVDINAGIRDGHTGSVPIDQSLRAFNVLAEANGHTDLKLTDAQIKAMTETAKVPAELAGNFPSEPGRVHKVLFRRQAGPARVTIFDGGHEMDLPVACDWLARLSKPAKPAK